MSDVEQRLREANRKLQERLRAFETEGFDAAVEVRVAQYHLSACSYKRLLDEAHLRGGQLVDQIRGGAMSSQDCQRRQFGEPCNELKEALREYEGPMAQEIAELREALRECADHISQEATSGITERTIAEVLGMARAALKRCSPGRGR